MIAWVARLILVSLGTWIARACARDFVRDYIRRLVRDRLFGGVVTTVSQLALLAATAFCVHRLGDRLSGRLFGSALVWLLIGFNLARFVGETVPEIAEARRHLAGPLGHVMRDVLGISIAKELVEMELFVLAVCLVLGLSVRVGVSGTFQLLAPWRELLGMR